MKRSIIFLGVAIVLAISIALIKRKQPKETKVDFATELENTPAAPDIHYTLDTPGKPISADRINAKTASELKQYFKIKKDEFDTDGNQWIIPKGAPSFVNVNSLHAYFQQNGSTVFNLRFRLQFTNSEWLFIQKVTFLADGKAFEYYPQKYENDVTNNGDIVEWFDDPATPASLEIMKAIGNATATKMKLEGRQYYKVQPISKQDRVRLKRTVEYFEALGGTVY